MKLILSTVTCFFIVFLISNSAYAVVAVQKTSSTEVVNGKASKDVQGLSVKQQKRFNKRMNRLNKRLKKKAAKSKKAPAIDASILDDARFRLGALVFLAGLALLLLTALFIGFGGLIAWVGRVATLVGLVLMIWALIENS